MNYILSRECNVLLVCYNCGVDYGKEAYNISVNFRVEKVC